jgi:tripartite-type tricarboxylate transporter receptor subunit TctC
MMRLAAAALAAFLLSDDAFAQGDYPARPVRIVVPYSAGGGADLVARIVAEPLGSRLGQPVMVENRVGAGGSIGMQAVAAAERDGYTLGLVTPIFVITPLTAKNPAYDALADFAPVGLVGFTPLVLAIHPGIAAKSPAEFIAYARSRPGALNFASLGPSSTQGLAAILFNRATGIDAVEVPYKGSAAGVTDLLAGNVQYMFNALPSMLPHIRAGKLRALAVTGERSSPLLPDVPALGQTVPGYKVTTWYALVAPAGTPREAIERINRELATILAGRDVSERLQGLGIEPEASTPEEAAALLRAESERWKRVVREAKIPLE